MDSGPSTGESTDEATENQSTDPTENTIGETQSTEPEETTAATTEDTEPTPETQPAPTGCNHEWQAATCDKPRMCAKCGKAEGHVLGHKLNQATCTEPQICTRCGMVSSPALGHTWFDATCKSPKTCGVCGATEGGLGDHHYMTNDRCLHCNAKKPVHVGLTDGEWQLDAINGEELDRFVMTFNSNGTGYLSVSFWGKQAVGQSVNFNGATYYDQGFGKGASLTYTENGDTVAVEASAKGGMILGSMTLTRTDINKYTISAVSGTIVDSSITSVLPVGTVFTGVGG